MNKDRQTKPEGRRDAARDQRKHDGLDTIEKADNRTERLNPHRGSATTDPVQDMLDTGESNAHYKDDANRVTPTVGPPDQTERT
jgi:hypothetical protein